jgi:hypothetical protein
MAFLVCFGRCITIHFPFNSVRFFEFSTYHATFDVIFSSLFMSRRTFYHGRLIKSNFYKKVSILLEIIILCTYLHVQIQFPLLKVVVHPKCCVEAILLLLLELVFKYKTESKGREFSLEVCKWNSYQFSTIELDLGVPTTCEVKSMCCALETKEKKKEKRWEHLIWGFFIKKKETNMMIKIGCKQLGSSTTIEWPKLFQNMIHNKDYHKNKNKITTNKIQWRCNFDLSM